MRGICICWYARMSIIGGREGPEQRNGHWMSVSDIFRVKNSDQELYETDWECGISDPSACFCESF